MFKLLTADPASNAHKQNKPQKSTGVGNTNAISSDGIIPDWTSLPHEILITIFRYASEPLRDDSLRVAKPTLNWLVSSSLTCKAFSTPALIVLYESPPLRTLAGPHSLLSLLKHEPHASGITYASKVKRFEVDAIDTVAYTLTGWGKIDLVELLSKMPQLSHVKIIESSDNPPYRQLRYGKHWTYPHDMFDTMSEREVSLRSWHWNAQMIKRPKQDEPMFLPEFAEFATQAHQTTALRHVRDLSISHLALYQRKRRSKSGEENRQQEFTGEHLAKVLASLKWLKHLSLVSCSAFERDMHSIMQALPDALESLAIKNTQGIYSEPLAAFLKQRGRYLRELVLDHNQALDLSFLQDLKESCPRLCKLQMDLTFYNAVASWVEKNPLFDTLLLAEDVPTWPPTLQTIELYNLRQWGSEAAEAFFMSLISSASELPDLRFLTIKAILDMSWRERAGFRETWIARLRHVFLRRCKPPNPVLASKRTFRESLEGLKSGILNRDASPHSNSDHTDTVRTTRNTRKSQRIQKSEAAKESRRRVEDSSETDAAAFIIPQKGPQKVLSQVKIQGMCNVVDVSIDNFRPAEVHFDEADFMDSAPEDDDWQADGPSETVEYAW